MLTFGVLGDIVSYAFMDNIKQVTAIMSPKETIVATKRTYKHCRKRNQVEVLVVVGRPNYRNRILIKKHLKNKGKFPIEDLLIKFITKQKRKK
jgi:hypothetical protein